MALYFPDRSAQGLQFGDEGNSGIAPSGGALYFPDRTAPGLQFGVYVKAASSGAKQSSYYLNETEVAERLATQPSLTFTGGLNLGAGNAIGIGIGTRIPNILPSDWTLLDQNVEPRTPQFSSHIGGTGATIRIGTPVKKGDGAVDVDGDATQGLPAAAVRGGEGYDVLALLLRGRRP